MRVNITVPYPKYYVYYLRDKEFREHIHKVKERIREEKNKEIKDFWQWRLTFLQLHPDTFRTSRP